MKNDSGKGWKKRSLHAFSRRHNGNDTAKKGEGLSRVMYEWNPCVVLPVTPVSPFQESRIMRSIVPGCCFCGRYGSSCATSYSWNVFAYSLMRISITIILPIPFRVEAHVKALKKHQLSTKNRPIFDRISTSILVRRSIGISVDVPLIEIKVKKFRILIDITIIINQFKRNTS